MIGGALSIGGGLTALAVAVLMSGGDFSPMDLFARSEPGAHWEVVTPASNTATFWQDSARTTLVTAVEQPVGAWAGRGANGGVIYATQSSGPSRPVLSARYNLLLATDVLATQSVGTVATNYVLAFSGAGSVTLSGTSTGTYSAGTRTITATAGSLTITVTGSVLLADLRLAADASKASLPAYQRVTTASDYDTVGFPHYLRFDGTDDSLQTSSIDFSGVDKMTVWAGLSKSADAVQVIVELTAAWSTNTNSFALYEDSSSSEWFDAGARGTAAVNTTTNTGQLAKATSVSHKAPISAVVVNTHDIVGDLTVLRINGSDVNSATGDKGAGNFANTALNIGRRNNATLPFKGNMTSLTVRGSTTPAGTAFIQKMEQYAATRAGLAFTST